MNSNKNEITEENEINTKEKIEEKEERKIDSKKDNKKDKKSRKIIKRTLLTILGLIIIAIVSFIIYEAATVNNTYYIGNKNINIPIFIYHNIVTDKSEVTYDYMQTPVDVFEKQMSGLLKLGYKPITYKDLVDYKEGKKAISKHSFLVTFDDGFEGVYKYAYPIAKKYNIPMSTFAIDDCIGLDSYFTKEQAKEMNDSNLIHIYSHGLHHIEYDKVDKNQLLNETNEAYNDLDVLTNNNEDLKVFAYPYGLYTDEETEILGNNGFIENLADNKVNTSNTLDLTKLHRCYALSDSIPKMLLKIMYRSMKYSN